MKEFIIDKILTTSTYEIKKNTKQIKLLISVELKENYFHNPYFVSEDMPTLEKTFMLLSFNKEDKLIQTKNSFFVFKLSDSAFDVLNKAIEMHQSQGTEISFSEEINFDKISDYQLNDYRPVFFDLKYCYDQENIKNELLDLVHETDTEQSKELELLSKVDFLEYDIPDEFFKEKIFMHQNNFSRNSSFKDLSDLLLKYVNSKAVFNNHFLNHIDLFNKKLMVVKSKTEMIIEKLLEEENLSNNQFVIYMDGRSISSNNEALMKDFAEKNETVFDNMFTICKHSETIFLIEKNNDSFSVLGCYTDEQCPLTYGYMFIGTKKTMELLNCN